MASHVTEAVVLHSFDYLESSRIIKLLTRDLGLRSALARGARKSAKRFGAALDLFVQGTAELEVKPGRDLDTLSGFDLAHTRAGIGRDLARFAGASALAELILRFARDDTDPDLFDITTDALDRIASASGRNARDAAIAGAWRILASLGFEPSLDQCGDCQRDIADDEAVLFSQSSGGVICERCAGRGHVGRRLPPDARAAIRNWLIGEDAPRVILTPSSPSLLTVNSAKDMGIAEPSVPTDAKDLGMAEPSSLTDAQAKAHQRLLREFVHEHLSDGRALKAFDAWETGAWSAT